MAGLVHVDEEKMAAAVEQAQQPPHLPHSSSYTNRNTLSKYTAGVFVFYFIFRKEEDGSGDIFTW